MAIDVTALPPGTIESPPIINSASSIFGSWRDHSGLITLGAKSQPLLPYDSERTAIIIINSDQSTTEPLWIDWTDPVKGAVASQPSIPLVQNGSITFGVGSLPVAREAFSVIAATTGHAFTCKVCRP